MKKQTLFNISNQVEIHISKQEIIYKLVIHVEVHVVCALYKLAQGCYLLVCSERFDVGQSIMYLVI
jgi:hypothetical protein